MKCAAGVGGDGDRISYIVWCLTPDDKNARRLTALVKGLARKHNAAISGGGDFNAAMESDAMKSIVADGLADAQATAAVSPKSFHTDHYDPRRDAKGAYHGVPAVRGMADKAWSLDHVFYDPATVSVSRFDLDITPEACAFSDHHPIVADFDLRKPEPAPWACIRRANRPEMTVQCCGLISEGEEPVIFLKVVAKCCVDENRSMSEIALIERLPSASSACALRIRQSIR